MLDLVRESDKEGHPCLLRAHNLMGGGGGGAGVGEAVVQGKVIVSALRQTG